MELHESLYALGRSQGRELFDDADSFRGALDDYLDEDSASTGDINLLVDAVRLGAFQSMVTMIDSGADSDRAVAEAGTRLARDRGSADVGGGMWACAVLGYAIGKVSDPQVRRYRTQHASAPAPPPAGPPTMLPPAGPPSSSPAGPPLTSPVTPPTSPVWPSSGSTPGTPGPPGPGSMGAPGAPPPAPQPFGQPVPSYGGYSHAAPKKKRSVWPILVAAVVALVLIGGGLTAFLLTQGNDDPGADPKKDPSGDGPDVSFEALNERYQSLGQMVTSGMTECAALDPASGEEEKIECTFPDGKVVLTTYSSDPELKAARKRQLNDVEGTIVSKVDSGAYYRFDPTTADEDSNAAPVLYWDSLAGVQSAQLTGGGKVPADKLDTAFSAISPTVTPPKGPVDSAVTDFTTLFSLKRCNRIPTEIDGETEESECRILGRRTWVGHFTKTNDLRRYRGNAKTLAEGDGDLVVDYWYNDTNKNGDQDDDEPEQGKIYGYIEDQGDDKYGVLYIDDLDCRCYLQMYDKGEADPEKLYNLVF